MERRRAYAQYASLAGRPHFLAPRHAGAGLGWRQLMVAAAAVVTVAGIGSAVGGPSALLSAVSGTGRRTAAARGVLRPADAGLDFDAAVDARLARAVGEGEEDAEYDGEAARPRRARRRRREAAARRRKQQRLQQRRPEPEPEQELDAEEDEEEEAAAPDAGPAEQPAPPPPPPPTVPRVVSGATVMQQQPQAEQQPPSPPRGLAPASAGGAVSSVAVSASGWVEPSALGLARAAAAVTEADAVRCNMPTGVATKYHLPAVPWVGAFDGGSSVGHLVYDAKGHMEDEYLFHNVKIVGSTVHVHRLAYYADGAPADAAAMPLRRGQPSGDLNMGISIVDSPEPLACPGGAVSDADWLMMLASSTENTFHQHNDDLLPYWQAAQQLAAGRDAALAAEAAKNGSPPPASQPRSRVVLYLAKTLSNWGAPSGAFWDWALRTGFDEVVGPGSPAVAGPAGVCVRNLRIGRPRKVFWASFQSLMNYASLNAVRGWADHLLARAGVAYPAAPPSWPPKATLIRRTRGVRRFDDEELLAAAFGEVGIPVRVVDLEGMDPKAQLEAVAATDILLAVHGAGLAMGLYLRPGSVAVQLAPTNLNYWETTLFHRLAWLGGVGYYQWDEHDPGHERSGEGGWGKASVKFRHEEEWAGVKWCEDTRVFVAQTAAVWVREAERAHALRLAVPALGAAALTSPPR